MMMFLRKTESTLTGAALCLVLALSLALAPSAFGQARSRGVSKAQEDQKLRVLFVGNSYTYFNNLPEIVSRLSAGKIESQMVIRGGASLKMHWEDGGAMKAIRQGRWDFVVLQEQSLLPINDPATMHQYARLFDAEIKKAGAKTVFFLTWARQNRPETQSSLTDAYTKIAKELNAVIAPVGTAWQSVFKENPQTILHLPDQSHPNSAGSYLAACVFYSIFYSKSPEALTARIEGRSVKTDGQINEEKTELVNLNKTDAALLQRIAWQTVKGLKDSRR
jgi:hypothetical protein